MTWNPTRGCSHASPGCANCYAELISARFCGPGQPFHTFAEREPAPHFTGRVELIEYMLDVPLKRKKPTTYFVNSMSDLFHESLPDEAIDRVFAVMALCPQHTFQVLTKRADRMRDYFQAADPWPRISLAGSKMVGLCSVCVPLPNVWLGVSVENQDYKSRIDVLRDVPAAVRFLSLEPLLEDLGDLDLHGIHWVIAGAESGRGARPMQQAWVRSIRDQCVAAGVKFFYKQDARGGRKIPTPELDGRRWVEMPEGRS